MSYLNQQPKRGTGDFVGGLFVGGISSLFFFLLKSQTETIEKHRLTVDGLAQLICHMGSAPLKGKSSGDPSGHDDDSTTATPRSTEPCDSPGVFQAGMLVLIGLKVHRCLG